MRTVKLLSWHEDVAAKAKKLARKGVNVDVTPLVRTSRVVGEMAEINPAALVLDLDRLPSNCREIALMLRASKSARHIPILFVGSLAADGAEGLPEKYARLKAELPDIPYAWWPDAAKVLDRLMREPRAVSAIVLPARVYTTSLAEKLGIVAVSAKEKNKPRQIALMGAPEGFVELLGELPKTVRFFAKIGRKTDLAICFLRSLDELRAVLDVVTHQLPAGASVWIVYPKKGRGRVGEYTENDVRNLGLAAGWIDYKIASIDANWSAMKFARRKAVRTKCRKTVRFPQKLQGGIYFSNRARSLPGRGPVHEEYR